MNKKIKTFFDIENYQELFNKNEKITSLINIAKDKGFNCSPKDILLPFNKGHIKEVEEKILSII